MELKTCTSCGIPKELSSFYSGIDKRRNKPYIFAICRSCHKIRDDEWKRKHPQSVTKIQRKYHLANKEVLEEKRRIKRAQDFIGYSRRRKELHKIKRKYGTLIDDLLKEQSNLCAICQTPFVEKYYDIDHSHQSGVIRGLLCRKCNSGLHYFEDEKFIEKAKFYITHTPASKFPVMKY